MSDSPHNRRLDRVLAAEFRAGIRAAELAELRAMRHDAEQEETDLSYLRRVVQGRIDILQAELNRRRSGDAEGSLLADLPRILADGERGAPHGLGRHNEMEPSRADQHRRHVEGMVADVDLSDVSARTDDELQRALDVFATEEADISSKRREVQSVLDECSAEITRRYRDGEADVADLLAGSPPT